MAHGRCTTQSTAGLILIRGENYYWEAKNLFVFWGTRGVGMFFSLARMSGEAKFYAMGQSADRWSSCRRAALRGKWDDIPAEGNDSGYKVISLGDTT
jgi:hypothetical protein